TALELGVLYLIFRPQLVGVSSYQTLLVLLVLIPISSILYWLVSLTVSLTTFWYYQNGGWGQRFLADLLISFFAGSYFPLEFFPDVLAAILKTLPTSLFFYTPMQLFLGRMTHTQAVIQIGIGLGWIGVFYLIARLMWRTGIKNYGAFGR